MSTPEGPAAEPLASDNATDIRSESSDTDAFAEREVAVNYASAASIPEPQRSA